MENSNKPNRLHMKKPSNIVTNPSTTIPIERTFLSPKLIRRKTENKQKFIQKTKDDNSELFCYISPNKNNDKIGINCMSTNSLAALCGSPR